MTRAVDDCFSLGAGEQTMQSLDNALNHLAETVTTVAAIEEVPLADALGRILAADLIAPRASPSFDNASVDGWAVRIADIETSKDRALPVAGRIAAGHPLTGAAKPGCAYRIFTGAVVPDGLDAVAMQEHSSQLNDGRIAFPAGLAAGANIRHKGEAMPAGAVALKAGTRLGPQHYGVAASLGLPRIAVRKRLRVGVLTTGDELRAPGEDLLPGCVYDSNRFTLAALLAGQGAIVTDYGIVPDRIEAIESVMAKAAAENDLIITSGGMSVGEEDHVKAALNNLGRLHFWRLAIKPGKPLALGQIGDSVFLGLPGNPVAVAITFALFAKPLMAALGGALYVKPRRFALPAAFHLNKRAGRQEFPRARIVSSPFGDAVDLFPSDSSGILLSLSESDGIVDLPREELTVEPGDMVSFIPFSEVLS